MGIAYVVFIQVPLPFLELHDISGYAKHPLYGGITESSLPRWWVRHDPVEILESVKICISKAIDKATADGYDFDNRLKAIGVTNKRETTIVWSK
ncbi:glycerol kinase [Tanacetum coccineum]